MKFVNALFAMGLIITNTFALAYDTSVVKNDPERLSKLIDLTNREIKTIKTNTYTGPELKHRLFELYTEKIKLIREKETALMLKEEPQTVQKRGKDSYFTASTEEYNMTQTFGLEVIKQYPSYNKLAEIYYTLAINSRDYGTNKETEQFLKLAIKNCKDNPKTLYGSKISLAEYYYNEKRYAEAITFYDDILQNKTNEWYGKHLYNASWCHLKEKHFARALDLIKESYETTKDKKFVSIREQILSAIGVFFVQADQTNQGISFFEKNTKPAAPFLLMLAKSSMNKNNFSITDEVLAAALKDTLINKDQPLELKVRNDQLDIYRESKKDDLFFNTANSIVELYKKNPKLPVDDMTLATNKIKDVSGFMQVNLVKDKNQDSLKYSKDDYRKIIKYFDMLTILDRPHRNQYRYYQGETALSVKDFKMAMKYYVRSIMNAKKLKDNGEFTRKSFDALLVSMEQVELPKKIENEYLIYTFKNYLVFYPQSEKSQVIYQKLFNKYFEQKKAKLATNIMLVYIQNYPSDEKIHREMLTQMLDTYIKTKNTNMIALWINKIEKGYLNFSQEYIQSSIAALGDLLFMKYHDLEKKGKIKEAMEGYEEIYDSKKYPNRIKAEAAYAMAAALLDLNNAKKSYKWLTKSLEIYDNKDLIKVASTLLTMNKNYRLLQNFEVTIELSKSVSKRFCLEKYEQKDAFYELMMTTVALENLEAKNLLGLENEFKECKFSERIEKRIRAKNLELMVENDRFNDAKEYFLSVSHTDASKKLMGSYFRFKFFQNPELYSRDLQTVSKIYTDIKLAELLYHYDLTKAFREKVNGLKFEFSVLDKFDANRYNSELEQYLSMLNDFSKEAVALSKDASPEEVILLREVLSKPYISLKKAVDSYNPRGVDNKYLQGFKGGMRQISESLVAKALQFDREKVVFLEKNNYFFQIQKHAKFDLSKEEIDNVSLEKVLDEHQAIIFANTMDVSMALNLNVYNGK